MVASLVPISRGKSAIFRPASCCFSTQMICSGEQMCIPAKPITIPGLMAIRIPGPRNQPSERSDLLHDQRVIGISQPFCL
jgi:hypothetical protein